MPPESSFVLSPLFTALLFVFAILPLLVVAMIVNACFRVRSSHAELFATKRELADGLERFEEWLKDVEHRHIRYQDEASKHRDELRKSVTSLSSDINRVLGRLEHNPHP